MLLETMEDAYSVGYEKRSRLLFECIKQYEEEETRMLCLNEVFCAEKRVAEVSRFCLMKDGVDLRTTIEQSTQSMGS